MILTDNETAVDLLNNEAIARTITLLLQEKPDKPITLGVHGDWGAGKSSVLEMIGVALGKDKNVLCIKFNSWQLQGFEDAKIALIEGIVEGLIEKRPELRKLADSATGILKRIDLLKLAKVGGGLAFTLHTGIPIPSQIAALRATADEMAADPGKYATPDNIKKVAGQMGGMLKPAEPKRVPEEVREFRKAFDDLLDAAKISQLVVLIDDLDRCLPVTAIDTLEAIRLLVLTRRTAFIIGADEAMIEYAVRNHFPDLPGGSSQDYARNYLEKLIQIPFRIPALGEAETRIYVALLLIGAVVGEEDEKFQKLVTEGRERLKRPWDSKPLDAAAVKTALGDNADALDMLNLADQVTTMLAKGTKGNPRQIKRFLNALLLRKSIADARGFGDEVQLRILAKLMLAERFQRTLFDQIAISASSNPIGKCKELGVLESTGTEQLEAASKDPALAALLGSEQVKSWSKLEPKLADVDLRPYLFVAKDKRDYFVGSSALGELGVLLDKLKGGKLAVQSIADDLRRLAAPDAAALFEELRIVAVGGDDYIARPIGMEGAIVLVEAQPQLGAKLLDLLESLPSAKLGAWAAGGWNTCIVSAEDKQRLASLIQGW
jgi:predicted KAP-like P-loop ATPase